MSVQNRSVSTGVRTEAGTVPVPLVAAQYGIDVKRLRGRIWRNGLTDPIGSLETDEVYVDWRLEKAAAELAGTQ